jgi:hypothetical protein
MVAPWRHVGGERRYELRDRIAERHRFAQPGPLAVRRVAGWRTGVSRRDWREYSMSRRIFGLAALVAMHDRCQRAIQSYGRRDMLHCPAQARVYSLTRRMVPGSQRS